MKNLLLIAATLFATYAFAEPGGGAVGPEPTLILVQQRISAKDLGGADALLRKIATKSPAMRGLHLAKGVVEEERGNLRAALWEYQWEMLRTGANRPEGLEAAERSADLVAAGSPAGKSVRAVLEAMAESQASPAEALAVVRSEIAKGETFVLHVFETELRDMMRDPATVELYRGLVKSDPSFVPAHLGLARALQRDGKTEESRTAYARAKEIDPDHWSLP